jgi:hypothetical protein
MVYRWCMDTPWIEYQNSTKHKNKQFYAKTAGKPMLLQ